MRSHDDSADNVGLEAGRRRAGPPGAYRHLVCPRRAGPPARGSLPTGTGCQAMQAGHVAQLTIPATTPGRLLGLVRRPALMTTPWHDARHRRVPAPVSAGPEQH